MVMKKTQGIGVKVVRKKPKGIGNPYLPDDIITNILCRLPAKNASQYRLVCKGWRDLTLNRDFVDLHFRHSFPMVLVANDRGCHSSKLDRLLLDKWWEPARTKLVMYRSLFDSQNIQPDYKLQFSHAGLVVFSESVFPAVIILNPINFGKVTITLCRELGLSEIYGVFFHPSLRVYCSLWRMEVSNVTGPTRISYMMLNLGSNPFLKTITNPFTHKVKKCCNPLFIGNYLYWMLEGEQKEDSKYSGRNDIMQFDIIAEEFTVKPCPVPVETKCDSDQTNILNIDGALSFLMIFPSNITIWRLKDHGGQLWTSAYYTFSTENFQSIPRPIALVDGILAVLSDRRLLVCNLMQGTMKYFRKKKYRSGVSFVSHQVSFASLRNCQLRIYLNEYRKINVV